MCVIFTLLTLYNFHPEKNKKRRNKDKQEKKRKNSIEKEEDKKYQEGEFHKFLLLITEDEKMEATKGIVVH